MGEKETSEMTQIFGDSVNSAGVWGQSTNANGVVGYSTNNAGVYGVTPSSRPGVWGRNRSVFGPGVEGVAIGSGPEAGVRGINWRGGDDGRGVYGTTGYGAGVGVEGRGFSGDGVWGTSVHGHGVTGLSEENIGVFGHSARHIGVFGRSGYNGRGASGAGVFDGKVYIHGDLEVANGNKSFKIDHPLDPQNKYLVHNTVESSERKNVYDGVVQLDEDGTASVDLPEWFDALNGDFRYQLTAVGGAAPNLHIAEEIYENRFRVGGGEGGMKVCWQVTGSRNDPWAEANPFEVEQEKPQEDRGRYLQPDLYDAPEEQSVLRELRQDEERLRQRMSQETPQSPEMPPEAPEMPEGFIPTPTDFVDLEEGHRQQIDELRGQIEELRRGRLEEEIDELRRQVKKLRRRRKR
jgi:hypothetical protein